MAVSLLRISPLILMLSPLALVHGQATSTAAGWKIEMRQVRLPVANGECGPIELVVRDASGNPPVSPDDKQLSWHDFDFALTEGAGAFRLTGSGNILCASSPGATGVVTAKYPESSYLDSPSGKGRSGKLLIPGAAASATLQVRSAGTAPPAVTTSLPPPPVTTTTGTPQAGAIVTPPPVPIGTTVPQTTAPESTIPTAGAQLPQGEVAVRSTGTNTPAANAGMTPVTGEPTPTQVIGTATPVDGAQPDPIMGALSTIPMLPKLEADGMVYYQQAGKEAAPGETWVTYEYGLTLYNGKTSLANDKPCQVLFDPLPRVSTLLVVVRDLGSEQGPTVEAGWPKSSNTFGLNFSPATYMAPGDWRTSGTGKWKPDETNRTVTMRLRIKAPARKSFSFHLQYSIVCSWS
jgi:hypothetical protein